MSKTPPEPTPEPEDRATTNLRFWRTLGKSDPRHTKPITGRGFDGTALKPMWQNMRMTEIFGPVGIGWGMDRPDFVIHTAGETMLVYCTVRVWYRDPEAPPPKGETFADEGRCYVSGVGGDVVAGKRASGKAFHDDEAYKKAYTDALGNAFKFIGVAADIHMGMFDDSKYVADLTAEFNAADDTLGKEVDALLDQIRTCEDVKQLVTDLAPVAQDLADKLNEAKRGGEVSMLTSTFNARKQYLMKKGQGMVPAEDPTNGDSEQT